jgi:hypothetical protein
MELASRHLCGAKNFEEAFTFLESLCTPDLAAYSFLILKVNLNCFKFRLYSAQCINRLTTLTRREFRLIEIPAELQSTGSSSITL